MLQAHREPDGPDGYRQTERKTMNLNMTGRRRYPVQSPTVSVFLEYAHVNHYYFNSKMPFPLERLV